MYVFFAFVFKHLMRKNQETNPALLHYITLTIVKHQLYRHYLDQWRVKFTMTNSSINKRCLKFSPKLCRSLRAEMKRTCNFVIGSLVWDTQWRGWEHHFLSTSATFCHYIWFAIYRYIYIYIQRLHCCLSDGLKARCFHTCWCPYRFMDLVCFQVHSPDDPGSLISDVILLTFVRIISWISRVDDYRGSTKKNTIWERFWWLENPWQQWLRVCFDVEFAHFFCVDLGLGQLVFKNYTYQLYIYIGHLASSTVGTWNITQIEVTLYF